MDLQKEKMDKDIRTGWLFFGLFVFFILFGIFVKRILGHAELMMLFHGPAAVFLVLSTRKLTKKLRLIYDSQIKNKSL